MDEPESLEDFDAMFLHTEHIDDVNDFTKFIQGLQDDISAIRKAHGGSTSASMPGDPILGESQLQSSIFAPSLCKTTHQGSSNFA